MTEPIRVLIKPSGSITLDVPVIVVDAEGNVIPQPTDKKPGITKFCGCGRSKSKPFCDGSHNEGR